MSMHEGGEPCPRCGLRSDHWTNNGQGYESSQGRYCCQGCAEASKCTCRQQMTGVSGK
jgi:hypothetical protein